MTLLACLTPALPLFIIWLARRRWPLWNRLKLTAPAVAVWLLSMMPVCFVLTVAIVETAVISQPYNVVKASSEVVAGGNLLPYAPISSYRLLETGLHGDGEWLGRDYVTACGTPLYNPLPNAHVDRLGTDNYCGPYGCGNTYLLISNEQYRLMLMHGDYIVHPGQVLQQGQQIGQTANNGNSSECHDHLALENKNGRILDISKLADTANGHSVTGYLSGYDKEPTDGTISIRQEWGQLPHDVSHYDTLIAVLDCGRIGQEATLNTESGRLEALVFDCAGSEDGGVEWMTSGNYVAELDYYSRSRYPHLMGTKATLIYKE